MSSFSSNQKCNSPKASAQALLARQFLEEHGWKVVENPKSRRAASSTPPNNLENDEVATPTTCNLPGSKPSQVTSSSFSGSKFFDGSSAPPSAGENVESVDDSGVTTTSNGTSYQRTKRGISNTESNFSIISDIQDLVCDVFTTNSNDPPTDNSETRESFKHTFVLPDFGIFPLEFREFLQKELIETSTLVSLEQTGRLNWWHDLRVCQRLLPLATTGDGNCLLHAASLGIWGFHDRRLTLRKALHDMLTIGQFKEDFKRRWKYHQEQVNKQSGLIYNEKEWTEEWDNLIKLASPQPRTNCDQPQQQQQQEPKQQQNTLSDIFYESLEELHVFVLAHVLGRPIIITADTILKDCNGDALAPISFGGIYLPLQISPHLCHRSPLVLSYDSAHFSALVPMKSMYGSVDGTSVAFRGGDESVDELPDAIPLVDSSLNLLPIHFLVDPDESVQMQEASLDNGVDELHKISEAADADSLQYDAKCLSVVSKYLDIQVIPIPSAPREVSGGTELSHSFSHLSLKLKSGSCNDIARVATQSHSSTQKSFTANESKDKEKSSSLRTEASRNEMDGAEEEASSNHVRAPSSLTSSPMAKGRMKLPQVAQNVVKTFNSLGRTVKKKIRQSSSSSPFKKVPSVEKKNGSESTKRPFKMSESMFRCGSLKRNGEGSKSSVFSSKGGKSNQESLKTDSGDGKGAVVVERNSVLCARLTHTRQLYQDRMMSNYLDSACQRFELLKQNKLASNCYGSLLEPTTDCINEGCDGLGTQQTSYLCRDCFERHMKEEMEHERTNMAAKILNRKSTAASASGSASAVATTGKVTGISSISINSSSSGFAGKKNLETAPLARHGRPDGAEDDDDDGGNSNNNNNNNADEDFGARLQYFTAMPPIRASPLPANTSSASSPLRPSTSGYSTNKPPIIGSHQHPPSSSSPRGRKPLPNLSTPTISYFSNFNASPSSALGRVESGPKLPTLPSEPGRRSLVCSPHRARIGISPSVNRSVAAKSSSPLVSRFASSSPIPVRNSPGCSSGRRFSRSNCEDAENVWSSRAGSSLQQCNLQQQQPTFQHSHRQQEQQQQQILQHSQRQLQNSLLFLQQQSTQGREPGHVSRSRQFENNLESELYSMTRAAGGLTDDHSPYRGYSTRNARAEDSAVSDGDFGLQRESSVIGCQHFEF